MQPGATRGRWLVIVAIAGLSVGVAAPSAVAATANHSWQMNEPAGATTMKDSGSTPTPGTLTDVVTNGAYYTFNGSSSVVRVPDASSLDPRSANFTIVARLKVFSVPHVDYDVIRKGTSKSTGGYWKMEIYPDSTGTKALALCQYFGSNGSGKIINAPSNLADGAWHTITCTKTSTAISLKVDATTYTKTVTIGSISNNSTLSIGAKSTGGDWFDGAMDAMTYTVS